MLKVPDEIMHYILIKLDKSSLKNAIQASSKIYRFMLTSKQTWKKVLGNISIFEACKNNSVWLLICCLNSGIDINTTDDLNQTCLHKSVILGHKRQTKFLIENNINVDLVDTMGYTALNYSITYNRIPLFYLLINSNASMFKGRSLLFSAILLDNFGMVRIILNRQKQEFPVKDNKLLQLAITTKNVSMVRLLLSYGYDPSFRDQDGWTCLHYAVQSSSVVIIKLILNAKVDVNVGDDFGLTPLHISVHKSSIKILTLLLENGADPNVVSHSGITPLYHACRDGYYNGCVELIKYGANPLISTKMGLNAIDIAFERNETEIIMLLQNK